MSVMVEEHTKFVALLTSVRHSLFSPIDTYATYATPYLLVNTWVLEVECHHLHSALPHVHGWVVGGVEPRTTRIGPHQVLLCASQHL